MNKSLVAQKISHELFETFNDPFRNGRQELGDGLENNTYIYKNKWLVQQYLSHWPDGINGEQPISLKQFLFAIGKDPIKAGAISSVGIKNFTVDAIADFFSHLNKLRVWACGLHAFAIWRGGNRRRCQYFQQSGRGGDLRKALAQSRSFQA